MALHQEDIARLAELTRLSLTEAEAEEMRTRLERVLGYVGRLSHIDTNGVPETEDLVVRDLRADAAVFCEDAGREIIIANFPDRMDRALRVPAVFEKPKG